MNYKRWFAVGLAVMLLMGLLIAIPILTVLNGAGSNSTSASCVGPQTNLPAGAEVAPTDPAVLAQTQTTNVRTIIATGEQMSVPDQGIIIALATASQESGFRMLANDGSDPRLQQNQKDVARSLTFPNDGVGRDHGSVNYFQQQYPGWGTLEELMNPQVAAVKFYQGLLKVPGWEAMAVTVAAQTVQRSMFPDAYADDEVIARRVYAEHKGASVDAPPLPDRTGANAMAGKVFGDPIELAVSEVLCGNGIAMDCPPTGDPAEAGLTPDALRVMRCITQNFGGRDWANVGGRPAGVDRDHQEGRAVDAMMTRGEDDYRIPEGKKKGDTIADWAVKNADALGVKYIIWHERIWTRNQDGVGHPGTWAQYDYPLGGNNNDTVAHRDHVHVSVYGNAAITLPGQGVAGDGNSRLPIDLGKYSISSGYGYRSNPTGSGGQFHAGLDFAAASGTPIFAVTGGAVTQASNIGDGYGNCVVINDGMTETRYAHQVDGGIKVKVGEQVAAGAEIGAVGTTGDSTGDHLHFEVRIGGQSTDPTPFLQTMGLTQ